MAAVALLVVLAAVAVTAAGAGGGAAPHRASRAAAPTAHRPVVAGNRRPSRRPRPAPHAGPYAVGMMTMTLSEPAPAAIATGSDASGRLVRVLPTVVRYPARGLVGAAARPGAPPAAESGPFPLVVFSQGYDISAEAYATLLDAWARAGFVVADPTYPRTAPSAPGGVSETDIVNHPADLRFVVSALTSGGSGGHGALRGLIDPRQVAVVGHSDGGDVSLAVAENTCCSDPAVRAAVILSGAELSAFGGRYGTGRHVPLLAVQGSADTINVPPCSVQLYDQAPPPKYYLDVPGAEHEPPYLNPGPMRRGVIVTVTAFLDAYLERRPAPLAALRRPGALPAGETLTSTAAAPPASGSSCPGAP